MLNVMRSLLIFSCSMFLVAAQPTLAAPQPGKDFVQVNPPQPTETGNKVEVLEIFSYACPHCNELEPKINEWVKHLPPNVVYRRMPAVFRDSWLPLAKTFYALEAIGETAKLHEKVFAAIHHDNVNLADESTLFAWVEKQGVDAKKFTAAFNSFGVQSKVQRAIQLSKSYGITGVPSVIVDGKILTSPSMTGSHESFFPVLSDLVKSAEKDHTAKN